MRNNNDLRLNRTFWLAAIAGVLLQVATMGQAVAAAELTERATFDIQPQALDAALLQFSQQAGIQISTPTLSLTGKTTPGIRGEYVVEHALRALLKDSGLTYTSVNRHTIAIGPAGKKTPAVDAINASKPMADAATSNGAISLVHVNNASASDTRTDSARRADRIGVEEVVVTGSRLTRLTTQGAQPVKVYNREEIERSGQTSIADFLNTLPEVSTSSVSNVTASLNVVGPTTVQLHGLPVGTTLVLIDGHRVQTSGASASPVSVLAFFDLNNIPVAAIERIEVLPVGSSAVYGSDALAGVVNLILKRSFDGIQANAHFGGAPGTDELSGSLAWGKTWGRGSASVIANYRQITELAGRERDATADNDYTAIGGLNLNAFAVCSPGNVSSANGANLPGLPFSSTGIPSGVSDNPSVQDFAATGGILNRCSFTANHTFIPPSEQIGLFARGRYDVTPSIELFSEVIFSRYSLQNHFNHASATSMLVPAANPYNPFGTDVRVSVLLDGLPRQVFDESTDFVRPLVGVRGKMFDDWDWELTTFLTRDTTELEVQGQITSADLAPAFASTTRSSLNPFNTNTGGSVAALRTLSVAQKEKYRGDAHVATAIVRGSLLSLPAGAIRVAIGSDYNRQSLQYHGDYSALQGNTADYEGSAYAFFTEARIPVLARQDDGAASDALAATVAVRYDNYYDSESSITPQYGLEWRPSASLLFRAAYAESFRAPSLAALYNPRFTSLANFGLAAVDPFRGNTSSFSALRTSGGNAGLQSETGQSRSTGIVWSSELLESSLSYWDIELENSIGNPAVQSIISFPELFPGRVVRAPPTAEDVARGWSGAITSIDTSAVNFGNLRVSGVDAGARFKINTYAGQFRPGVNAVWTERYDAALVPGAPVTDRVSAANTAGFAPRWKGMSTLAWSRGPYSAHVAGRYVGRYFDYRPQPSGERREIGDVWYWDVNAQLDLGRFGAARHASLSGSYLQVGAVNVFDKTQTSNSNFGYDPRQGDLRGRFLYASIGVRWQ